MKKLLVLMAFAICLFVTACNSDKNKPAEATPEETPAEGPAKKLSNVVEITANDQMQFSTIEINVKAGEKVRLTLTNIGTMPKAGMAHNWILLKEGTDLAAFTNAAVNVPDHIPPGDPNILAHTKLLGPGESDTIEFTVPAGSYTFICSFPAHYKTMTGVLTAE